MKEPKFTEQQISFILNQDEGDASIEETCRRAGISLHAYLRLRAKYGGLSPEEISRVHRLEDETKRLKLLLATLILERQANAMPPLSRVAPASPAAPRGLPPQAGPAIAARKFSPPVVIARKESSSAVRQLRTALAANLSRALNRVRPACEEVWLRVQEAAWILFGSRGGREAAERPQLRGRSILLLLFAVGVGGGFAYGLREAPVEDQGVTPVPIDFSLRANSYGSVSSRIDAGWERPQPWGTWMADEKATILLGFDGPSRGDVELLVDARVQPPENGTEQTLVVRFNDTELGRWRLPTETRDLRRRFIIPKDVFNRNTAAQLAFELTGDADPAPGTFGLRAVALRDARFLHDYKGFLDSCSPDKLVGWAVAEGSAVTVEATVDGEPIKATLVNDDRPDLARQGLPDDAGFVLTPDEPIAAGSKVEVRFSNGRRLQGSPCQWDERAPWDPLNPPPQ